MLNLNVVFEMAGIDVRKVGIYAERNLATGPGSMDCREEGNVWVHVAVRTEGQAFKYP